MVGMRLLGRVEGCDTVECWGGIYDCCYVPLVIHPTMRWQCLSLLCGGGGGGSKSRGIVDGRRLVSHFSSIG